MGRLDENPTQPALPRKYCLCHPGAVTACHECAARGYKTPNPDRPGLGPRCMTGVLNYGIQEDAAARMMRELCRVCGRRLVATDDDKSYCRKCEQEVR